MKTKLVFTLVLFFLSLFVIANVVESEDKNGKRVLINKGSKSVKKISKNIQYKKSPNVSSTHQNYLLKMKKLSKKYQLREDLIVAVAKAESGFNPYAISRSGAVGIMQLMQSTAKKYGVSNRFNIDENLEAGVRHLKYLYRKYNQNLPLTLAAYNAGEEAVKKYDGIPPFRETKVYIKRVMRTMGIGYSKYFRVRKKTRIYKYTTKDGRVVITDTLPSNVNGKVEVID